MSPEVVETNQEILQRLGTVTSPQRDFVPQFFHSIVNFPADVIDLSLGTIGNKLRDFLALVDFNHPDLSDLFDGVFKNETPLSGECRELLQITKVASDMKLRMILPHLHKVLQQEIPKEIMRRIESPFVNRLHVRFLKHAEDRQKIRATKNVQTVDLRSVCKKGEEIWQSQPCSFKKFMRFDKAYQDEIEKVQRKAQRYLDMGCTGLYNEVKKSIDAFTQQVQDSYYGFNRITLTSAAVIMAKSMGHKLHQPYLLAQDYQIKRDYRIKANADVFKDYPFEYDTPSTIMGPIYKVDPELSYEPMIYPLHELWEYVPDTIMQVFDYLEAMPDANNKPIFDHFGVLVPSVRCPVKSGRYNVLNSNGIIQSFNTAEEAQKTLDVALMKQGIIHPAFVGERDGKCYFICFFV